MDDQNQGQTEAPASTPAPVAPAMSETGSASGKSSWMVWLLVVVVLAVVVGGFFYFF